MIVLTVSHDSDTLTIDTPDDPKVPQITFAPIKPTQLSGILSELLHILDHSGVELRLVDEGKVIKREEW